MPPRHAYWTILVGAAPTAFRAKFREELLPTFERLRQKQPEVVLRWFEGGHRDPRDRFKGKNKPAGPRTDRPARDERARPQDDRRPARPGWKPGADRGRPGDRPDWRARDERGRDDRPRWVGGVLRPAESGRWRGR